jgi:putative ABC transport system ATP-binding protein
MIELAVRDLVVEYAAGDYSVRPIDGLELDAAPGELVLLLGPSGCGKTSLLSCLAGILRPSKGTIRFGSTDVTSLEGAALTAFRRHTVGVVFQAFHLVGSLTALENVDSPMRAAGVGAPKARRTAERLLAGVGLQDRLQHRPGSLSGGQQQRVAIARALAMNPPVVLADEPTAHLDYVQAEGVVRILHGLARKGRLVIVSTHDERLVPIADRVVELSTHPTDAEADPVPVTLDHGEILFEQGQAGSLIYVVEAGEVEVLRGGEVLGVYGPGEYFGELAPLLGFPRTGTARARTSAVLTGYTVRAFRERVGIDRHTDILRT